jgi:biotin carboxyl carrier protein
MKLKAEVDAETYDIELEREGERLRARVNAREYDLEFSEPEQGVFLLKNDGKIYEAAVSPTANDHISVRVRNTEFEVAITDPKRLRGSAAVGEDASGKAEIRTAMPGKVVRILKAVGDAVQKGDGVIVVEAMKMQNEMRSPKDGTISDIKVVEGETVSSGDVLVVIE